MISIANGKKVQLSYGEWADRIAGNFEKKYYIPLGENLSPLKETGASEADVSWGFHCVGQIRKMMAISTLNPALSRAGEYIRTYTVKRPIFSNL